MKTPILLIGGGGHALSLISVIEATSEFVVAGIVESTKESNHKLLDYPILGTDQQLAELLKQIPTCVIAIGQVKTADTRKKLFAQATLLAAKLPIIIAPNAQVASSAKIGKGTCIMHNCIVSHLSTIGDNTIINNKALIEHQATIGNHCHISTGVLINGGSSIGDECFIGSGTVVLQGISICKNTIVGAGSVVINNITEAGTYAGNPASKIQ